ncbi:hypothetical protein GALMADRAFT_148169 [Galerina marginata CBS 339.88]|uniref:Uncharacterized protein n=1 Tax=Galerina marginata (strain CBS 339.88) TaxID=685588 RepID=A0A067S5N0_GALM3|nr:hypothetical protein GALMADRAFT_148169 [Galerina marginata CBS 339.88]
MSGSKLVFVANRQHDDSSSRKASPTSSLSPPSPHESQRGRPILCLQSLIPCSISTSLSPTPLLSVPRHVGGGGGSDEPSSTTSITSIYPRRIHRRTPHLRLLPIYISRCIGRQYTAPPPIP